jgi:hypothetical protein
MFLAPRWHVRGVEETILRAGEKMPKHTMPWICRTRTFNYDEFVKQEFGSSRKPAIKRVWWITAILLIAAFIAIYFYAAR